MVATKPRRTKRLPVSASGTAPPSPKQNPPTKRVCIHQRTYEELVQLTQEHERFPDWFAAEEEWISTASMKPTSKSQFKRIVAMDCEMCVTVNTTTNVKDSRSLVRVTLIDGDDPEIILVDLIVHQPSRPGYVVSNYKTFIHGISAQTISKSTIEPRRARKEILKHIGPHTIVVGHSVNGDLASLGIAHTNVIDTALLFGRKNTSEKEIVPGLRELTKQLLHVEMPDVHDSYLDAKMTMLAAQYALTHPIGNVIVYGKQQKQQINQKKNTSTTLQSFVCTDEKTTVQRTSNSTDVNDGKACIEETDPKASQWLVHHIPKGVFNSDIEQFLISHTSVVPLMVENIVFKENHFGSCAVYFPSKAHADVAFSCLRGPLSMDPLHRPVKVVQIPNGKGTTVFRKIKMMKAMAS
jgi:hypothetical protein